jgi:hypothetical protein
MNFCLIDSAKSDVEDDDEEDDEDEDDDRPHKENLSMISVPLPNGESAIVRIFNSINKI